jgi:tetratricopeptide (TPR) repeat protein
MELTIEQALQQAVEAHKAGKLQDAEALYRAILQAQPRHPDANHNLGVLAVSLHKTEAALPLFKISLEANPNQGQFWLSYVDALIKEKQFDNARKILEQGKKRGLTGEKVDHLDAQLVQLDINLKSQKTEPNKLSKAVELREMGRYREAQDWLNEFLEDEPTDAEGWSLLSQLFFLDNKDAQAEKAIANAILINPNLSSIYRNQARLLLKNSKPAEALLKAQSGFEKSTEDPESWNVLAACLGANQRDLEALPLIERALIARPNYAEAFVNRAMVRLRAKNTTGAIDDLEKVGILKPHFTQIWELLGTLRYQNKDLSGAIEALKKAQALEPDNVYRMINLGEYLRQDQRIEEAIAILEEATVKAPKNANAWINFGTALQQDNKIENAKVAYKKALSINPISAEVCNNLGSIAKDTKDWESARKYFEQAITIKPDLVEAHSNLGIAMQELGRLEDAEASYNKAIAIKPDYAEAYSNLGLLLTQTGDLEGSQNMHERAIKLDSEKWNIYYNYSICLFEIGHIDSAADAMKKAESIAPENIHKQVEICLKAISAEKSAIKTKAEETYQPSTNLKFGLRSDPLILSRPVENELIARLYQMNSRILDKTLDARYGNGKCSIDFELFDDKSQIIQVIAQDLTKICRDAVASEVYIYDSFFNIYGAGAGTEIHNHINSHDKYFDLSKRKYSLVYYLDVGDQSGLEPGALRLFNPVQGIMPLSGMIVIINANKKHHALYDGKTDRIMIGVNFYSI